MTKFFQCSVDNDGFPTCQGDGGSCGPDGVCWSFRFPERPERQFTVSTAMPGVVRLVTNTPLDQPEVNNRHMTRDMSVTEAVELIQNLGEAVLKALRMTDGDGK